MSTPSPQSPKWDRSRVIKIAIGAVIFGTLMGIRTETDPMWFRALLGACAGAGLALSLMAAMGRRS